MIYFINVHATYNNTIISLSNKKGEVVKWSSSGSNKFKGSKKSTPFAAQISAEKISSYLKIKKINKVNVVLNGPGLGRDSVLRTLNNNNIKIISIIEKTSIPHNGCRPPKKRRV
ncbi:30S ribosomal protein S11 [Candidatus Vidania fulgoroideorum]